MPARDIPTISLGFINFVLAFLFKVGKLAAESVQIEFLPVMGRQNYSALITPRHSSLFRSFD
jgi:hypothetical protein